MRVHLQAEYYRVSALFEVIQLWAFSITRESSRRDVVGLVAEDVAPGNRPGQRPAIPDAAAVRARGVEADGGQAAERHLSRLRSDPP